MLGGRSLSDSLCSDLSGVMQWDDRTYAEDGKEERQKCGVRLSNSVVMLQRLAAVSCML